MFTFLDLTEAKAAEARRARRRAARAESRQQAAVAQQEAELNRQMQAELAEQIKVEGIPLPKEGRSSEDETLNQRINNFLTGFREIAPGINHEALACLKALWISNPDLSQAVTNLVSLANTGHQIVVDAPNATRAEAAVKRLNETAGRIYPHSYGIDGLVNDAVAQVAWSGTFSREDIVDLQARQIKKVVLVPPEQIRFRPKDAEWQPYQQPRSFLSGLTSDALGMVSLHPTTYRYLALEHVDDSPYAKPPFTAALDRILITQASMLASLDKIVQKFSLFGLMNVAVTHPPRKPGQETEEEYQKRAQAVLKSVREAFEAAMASSKLRNLFVSFKDQAVNTTAATGDARGASELFSLNEQQVFSGLASMPAFHGRNDTTTETFADVVFYILAARALNMQRVVKRGIERTYQLDLALGGIEVDGVALKFNPIRSRNMLQEAQAEQLLQQIIFADAQNGMISPDEAAQKRGYEKAHDATKLGGESALAARGSQFSGTFAYDRDRSSYRFVAEPIVINTETDGKVIRFAEKKKKLKQSF